MDLAANLKPVFAGPRQWRLIVWLRVKNGWRSSTAAGSADDQPVEVLCEDHSGTYQLPFACRWIDGQWRNDRTGGMVEATVVGWRLPRSSAM
jgi:hypothetical protein